MGTIELENSRDFRRQSSGIHAAFVALRPLSDRWILVIDPIPVRRMLTENRLSRHACSVVVTGNGGEGSARADLTLGPDAVDGDRRDRIEPYLTSHAAVNGSERPVLRIRSGSLPRLAPHPGLVEDHAWAFSGSSFGISRIETRPGATITREPEDSRPV